MKSIYGILSDTHNNRDGALEYIIQEFQKRSVTKIIHCGDINPEHLSSELFGNLPVYCALIDEQVAACNKGEAECYAPGAEPSGWVFTRPNSLEKPNERIVNIGPCYAYVGHKRSFDLLHGSENELLKKMHAIRRRHNNVRAFFSGHTHHQIYMGQPLLFFINPGAVEGSFGAAGGHEFAIVDFEKDLVIFSRIQNPTPTKNKFNFGVVSDSFDVSEMIPDFWIKLCRTFKAAGVTHIIHCGNIDNNDIGLPCLEGFEVFYNLRSDQEDNKNKPNNWHAISSETPLVEINGYKFLVQLSLGTELLDQSEVQMHKKSLGLQIQYAGVHYILCGQTRTPFLEEAQNVILFNPGGGINGFYGIISLPQHEITFGRIKPNPLPPLSST